MRVVLEDPEEDNLGYWRWELIREDEIIVETRIRDSAFPDFDDPGESADFFRSIATALEALSAPDSPTVPGYEPDY